MLPGSFRANARPWRAQKRCPLGSQRCRPKSEFRGVRGVLDAVPDFANGYPHTRDRPVGAEVPRRCSRARKPPSAARCFISGTKRKYENVAMIFAQMSVECQKLSSSIMILQLQKRNELPKSDFVVVSCVSFSLDLFFLLHICSRGKIASLIFFCV